MQLIYCTQYKQVIKKIYL